MKILIHHQLTPMLDDENLLVQIEQPQSLLKVEDGAFANEAPSTTVNLFTLFAFF